MCTNSIYKCGLDYYLLDFIGNVLLRFLQFVIVQSTPHLWERNICSFIMIIVLTQQELVFV